MISFFSLGNVETVWSWFEGEIIVAKNTNRIIEQEENIGLRPHFFFPIFSFLRHFFLTHQVPRGLQVDEVVNMGQHAMHMSLVKEEL